MIYNESRDILTDKRTWSKVFAIMGVLGMSYGFAVGNISLGLLFMFIPIVCVFLIAVLYYSQLLFYFAFIVNYFIISLSRYGNLSGVSVIMDSLMIFMLGVLVIQTIFGNEVKWKAAANILTYCMLFWTLYCALEIGNPSGMIKAWVLSRKLIINGLVWCILVSILLYKRKHLDNFLYLYAGLTLLAFIKLMIQKHFGFDTIEMNWLISTQTYKTHLLPTGIRYFSFFSDAGNFGSNMGCAGITFTILAFYVKKIGLKLFYLVIGIMGFYAMFQSGTRGAMIVPLGGMALLILMSKNLKVILSGSVLLFFIYVFFAFTYIGEGNTQIRRMRTAFKPNEDPSYLVRKRNQRRLAQYLKNKPFGEGIGLSGVENQKTSVRFTTQIPVDSWYVKIWVETGVVGLLIYITSLIIPLSFAAYTIMFKMKDRETKGKLMGMLAGAFGMMLSAYGNAFFGQYPTMLIIVTCLSFATRGDQFDPIIEAENKRKKGIINEKDLENAPLFIENK